jgi:CRP-like cAMP-binding protein
VNATELKPFALFGDLGDGEREELAALLEPRDLSVGETLFVEGEESDALLLVLRGSVELASRRSVEKIAVGAGGTIGLLALFAVGARATSAVGVDASDLLLLRREEFLRFAEDHPRAAFRIAAAAAAEVAQHARAVLTGGDASVG